MVKPADRQPIYRLKLGERSEPNHVAPAEGTPLKSEKKHAVADIPSRKYGNPIISRIVGTFKKQLTISPTNK